MGGVPGSRDGCFGQRECARRRRGPTFTRKSLQVNKCPDPRTGTNNESHNETVKKQRVLPVTTTVTTVEKQQLLLNMVVTLYK